jgi:hypothetical protein
MKQLKPGQLCIINGTLYRAKKRTDGCSGCSLDNFFVCPSIKLKNKSGLLDCYSMGIILVRVLPKR